MFDLERSNNKEQIERIKKEITNEEGMRIKAINIMIENQKL